MAAPIISAVTGYLGFKRYEAFLFQISISGASSVVATTLPASITFDDSAYTVSSAGVPVAGSIVFTVTATNGDGSTSRTFCIGIGPDAASQDTDQSAIDIVVDAFTRKARLGLPGDAGEELTADTLSLKFGDVIMFAVRFEKNGVRVDPDPTSLKITGKKYQTDPAIVNSLAFEKIAEGDSSKYNVPVPFAGNPLQAALDDEETDTAIQFLLTLEIEWKRSVTHSGQPLELVSTSRNFVAEMVQDETPNS